jgi:menaquinone-dependent protoporphyrinogen IX oxidase
MLRGFIPTLDFGGSSYYREYIYFTTVLIKIIFTMNSSSTTGQTY